MALEQQLWSSGSKQHGTEAEAAAKWPGSSSSLAQQQLLPGYSRVKLLLLGQTTPRTSCCCCDANWCCCHYRVPVLSRRHLAPLVVRYQ
jgi:hypothetical protein